MILVKLVRVLRFILEVTSDRGTMLRIIIILVLILSFKILLIIWPELLIISSVSGYKIKLRKFNKLISSISCESSICNRRKQTTGSHIRVLIVNLQLLPLIFSSLTQNFIILFSFLIVLTSMIFWTWVLFLKVNFLLPSPFPFAILWIFFLF